MYWIQYKKESVNPLTKEIVQAERRKIKVDHDIPMQDAYDHFILKILEHA